jgi:magnesium chelatase family protein
MSLALAYSRARSGVHAPEVLVEVFLAPGLPNFFMVGLPEAAVRESRDRVHSAIITSALNFPSKKIITNLSPADLPKDGGRFDLPIAVGILAAAGDISTEALQDVEFFGELSLTGELRAVDGVLPAVLAAGRAKRSVIVPLANAGEASLASDVEIYAAKNLLEVIAHLNGVQRLPAVLPLSIEQQHTQYPDLSDVKGQTQARRALEIAAAGGHHLLFIGPPGCGKTLLASRLPGILPEASDQEALESAAIASISGRGVDIARWKQRPYRSPHSTASGVALVGGGAEPRPGEISLAHNGVLFLDELAEWDRRALEVLREPLESGVVTISRAARQAEFPARFQLVAAMNPCPCGWAGDPSGRCRCSPDAILRYRSRLSGPLLDRIDLQLCVPRLAAHEIRYDAPKGESTAQVRQRVVNARGIQAQRSERLNAHLNPAELHQHCHLQEHDQQLLEQAMECLQLSARSAFRVLRVARTIADLAHSPTIQTIHLSEALSYRPQAMSLAVTV